MENLVFKIKHFYLCTIRKYKKHYGSVGTPHVFIQTTPEQATTVHLIRIRLFVIKVKQTLGYIIIIMNFILDIRCIVVFTRMLCILKLELGIS